MTDQIKNLLSLPPLHSKQGAGVDDLILYVHYLMAALFVIWIVYFFYALFRFSAKRNPKANYDGYTGKSTTYMEVGVAVVEGVLLVALAIPLWANAADGFPQVKDASGKLILDKDGKPAVTEIRVVAQTFDWNYRYPGADGNFGPQDLKFLSGTNEFGLDMAHPDSKDDALSRSLVVVPVNKPVILHISSKDVIHSWAVHPFRITQDAIPGISIPTHFTPIKQGIYQVTCAQLCGAGHFSMNKPFKVVSQQEYDAWLATLAKLAGGATSFE